MKKIALLFLISIVACINLFAGPFGLSQGMTFDEVIEACSGQRPERISSDDRYFIKPAKSHSRFKTYIAWISDDYGLYAIRGISDTIYTDKYGKDLKEAFYAFKDRVSSIYGKCEIADGLVNNKISDYKKGDDYWSSTLKDGDRELYAKWAVFQKDVKMKDDLIYIKFWAIVDEYVNFEGTLLIDYYFSNSIQVEDKEDDVL